ncbi:amidohydrolase [Gemmatimonas groenlandica]|uniref:Amidohydrolase n=1 Tax=Gemmatimonas groenlandica TaxID=2732249 RepID=A0A6M4IRY6_9BACT|nr:amidohydrolase [Gemmatimonas groenlandica]QJR36788.1 amidohydrolase [Gemmatimonas groenlandica]
MSNSPMQNPMTTSLRTGALLAALAVLAPSLPAQPAVPPADAIYTNARIWTGDAEHPAAQALAIRGGKLVAVGSAAQALAFRGPSTKVIDLQGRRVVPGFSDSHWHLSLTDQADLTDAKSPAEIVRRLKAWAAKRPAGAWVVGRGWTPSDFPNNTPHRRFLDAAFPNQPVVLTDRDGHQSIANGRALALAKVTATTPDPARGVIEREANGVPTGLLKESARQLVVTLVPSPTPADMARRIDEETRKAASFGIVLIQDASGRAPDHPVFTILRAAAKADTLRVRYRAAFPFTPDASAATVRQYTKLRDSTTGPWLRVGIAKGMLDGTVDAKTAAMLEPYAGSDDTGLPFWPAATLNKGVARYDSAGIQVELHAIGDRAVRTALDAYANATKVNRTTGRRHRIEHIEVPALADLPRFKQFGVIASTQAIFATPDQTTLQNYAPLLGPERSSRANAFKKFDDAGAIQAFGSDYPVFPMDVLLGIYTAVTRQTPEGTPKGGWYPENRITVEAALRHYTKDAAYAAFMEKETGSLVVGHYADFVVLSSDILTIPPAELLKTRILLTIIGGREAYRSTSFP